MEFKFDVCKSNPGGVCAHLPGQSVLCREEHMEKPPSPLSPYPKYSLLLRTTDVQSPSIHLTKYPEGCHHMKTVFEEVENGPSAQESMLPNKSERKPLPPHELLVYERGPPIMSTCVASLVCLGQDIAFNPHIVNYWHAPYWELKMRKKYFMTLSHGWTKRGFKPPSGRAEDSWQKRKLMMSVLWRVLEIWRVREITQKCSSGTSLVVQQLRLHTSNGRCMGSIIGQGTKIPCAVGCS